MVVKARASQTFVSLFYWSLRKRFVREGTCMRSYPIMNLVYDPRRKNSECFADFNIFLTLKASAAKKLKYLQQTNKAARILLSSRSRQQTHLASSMCLTRIDLGAFWVNVWRINGFGKEPRSQLFSKRKSYQMSANSASTKNVLKSAALWDAQPLRRLIEKRR